MAEGRYRHGRPKRLTQLLWLLDHHRDELQLTLLRQGYRLADIPGRLSWHDTWLMAAHSPAGTPLAGTLDPRARWSGTDWWLRSIEYSLRWLVWAQTRDGQKGRNRPVPVSPPTPPEPATPTSQGEGMRMDRRALTALLNRPRRAISASTHTLPAD